MEQKKVAVQALSGYVTMTRGHSCCAVAYYSMLYLTGKASTTGPKLNIPLMLQPP